MRYALLAGTIVAGLAVSGAAKASITIDSSNWGACVGAASCNPVAGVTMSALGDPVAAAAAGFGIVPGGVATMTTIGFAGATGLGINYAGYGGNSAGTNSGPSREIQHSETLKFAFADPVVIESLQLVFLYNPQAFSTDPKEVAIITGNPGGGSTTYTLKVNSNAAGDFLWDGPGAVTRDSTAQGLWTFSFLFGDEKITELKLTSALDNKGNDGSDYAFLSLTTAAVSVPEPATLGLLGAGLLGLGFAARRRRAA